MNTSTHIRPIDVLTHRDFWHMLFRYREQVRRRIILYRQQGRIDARRLRLQLAAL